MRSGGLRLFAAVAWLSLFVACGGDDEASTARPADDTAAEGEAAVASEIVSTELLQPSEIRLSGVGASSVEGAAATSELQASDVDASEIERVEQILTELGAERTPEGITINLPENVLFDFDRAELRPDAEGTLTKIHELATHYREAPIAILGHTDSVGGDQYNQELSDRRAQAVRDYLVKSGIAASRLDARGMGESQPIAPNTKPDGRDDPAGRQKNRRVEVIIRSGDGG